MPQVSLLAYIPYLQLEDGDIICFQKASSMDSGENVRYPDVPSYLEYVHNRQVHSFFCYFIQICLVFGDLDMKLPKMQ